MTAATVTPLTADMVIRLRGPRRHAPVQVGHVDVAGEPSVVMVIDPEHAEVLAKVIARFDAEHTDDVLDFPFDRDTWMHAMVDLLASKSLAVGQHAEIASVTHLREGR